MKNSSKLTCGTDKEGFVSKCEDCSGEHLFDQHDGDGKCGTCDGKGVNPNLAALAMGEGECPDCHGNGVCQTCGGDGEL